MYTKVIKIYKKDTSSLQNYQGKPQWKYRKQVSTSQPVTVLIKQLNLLFLGNLMRFLVSDFNLMHAIFKLQNE